MLEASILEQVKGVYANLDAQYTFKMIYNKDVVCAQTMQEFLTDFVSTSDKLSLVTEETEERTTKFIILKDGKDIGVTFRGVPNGHEFTTLILAVYNADGKGKNLPDATIAKRVKAINGEIDIKTYVSLSCTNCPDVVQALNIMAILNPSISHEIIVGENFQEEVEAKRLQGVPAVFIDDELFHSGKSDFGTLLQALEDKFGSSFDSDGEQVERNYDVIVVGGGPAGSSAAIYSARKGLKVAIVAETIGGQVKETVGIENLISVPKTTGAKLASDLKEHINDYDIEVFENRSIKEVSLSTPTKRITVKGGEVFIAPAVILATGASWRKLNVDGEAKYMGKGVHFCPHCDGPFYKGKHVAVIGGGNSGIEAAIDLAGICSKVTVLEFADTLRADTVLQDKAASMGNIEIFKSSQTTEVLGNGDKVTGLKVKDRTTDVEREISLDGIFVQIGLSANSAPFAEELELTRAREVIIDAHCRTSVAGVYAAGDVSSVPYKQIVIAMGEGAKAALSAFEDRMRGVIG